MSRFGTTLDRLERANKLTLGTIAIAVVLAGYVLVWTNTVQRVFGPHGYELTAEFADTSQLAKGSMVRVNGVKAGVVQSLDLNDGGRSARVKLEIYPDAARHVYRDATATIRWRNLLGGTFVVDLDPGTARSGDLGSAGIAKRNTATQVEIEDVTRVMRGGARAGLKRLVHEVPSVLAATDQPSALLRAAADASPDLEVAASGLRGQRDGDLPRLIRRTSAAVTSLDADNAPIRALVQNAATTFAATARERTAIQATMQIAARIQPNARTTLTRLRTTLGRLDPVVAKLRRAAPRLEPAANDLRPAVLQTDQLLQQAAPALRQLTPSARDLAEAARFGAPLLRDIAPSVARLDDQVLPGLAKVSPESKRPTYQMIGPAVEGLAGAGSAFDGESNFAVLYGSGSDRVLDTLPCRGYLADSNEKALFECNALFNSLGRLINGGGKP
jgi:virulence factor Mce-like protein